MKKILLYRRLPSSRINHCYFIVEIYNIHNFKTSKIDFLGTVIKEYNSFEHTIYHIGEKVTMTMNGINGIRITKYNYLDTLNIGSEKEYKRL